MRVVPSMLEILDMLETVIADVDSFARTFAQELKSELFKEFDFIFDENSAGFKVIYWVGCYMDPIMKFLVDDRKKVLVLKYLEGKTSIH